MSSAQILVTPKTPDTFEVTVEEAGSSTIHVVTADPAAVARFGRGASAEGLIEASFRFLLDREPKEAILTSFDLPVIGRYFPDYSDRIAEYLA